MKLEIGSGYRRYRLDQPAPPAAAEETQSEALLRVNASYVWVISKTSKFTEDIIYE